MSAKLTAMMLGVATVSHASAARVLVAEQMNCGDLGQEWCADESCKYDYLPVNLGGASTICRKKEEAEASGGIMGDGKGNGGGGGGDSGADNMGGGDDMGSDGGDNMPPPESMPESMPQPESMPESSPSGNCGGERQPVCAGDQMNGRNFECDYGFVGENGTCVPYEDHITSTPVPTENSMLSQRGSEPTDEDVRNSPLMQALNGIGGGDQPVPAGFEPDPNPEVDNDMGEVADGGDAGMDTPATTPTPPSTTAPGVGGTGSPTGQAFSGHITHFDAMGVPHGGCGISMERSVDDNGKKLPFLALNTNSLFENGANCGRWVEITLEENCDGGGNGQWSICQGGNGFQNDEHTGEVIYGYVLDSCGDNNFWCQNDPGHLDLSTPYLQSLGLIGEHFNARKSSWSFMDGAPPGWSMSSLKFQWMQGAQWLPDGYGFHAPLVIYNTDNGISGVEILDPNGTWKPAAQLTNLGNVWDLPEPSDMRDPAARQFTIRVTDMSGNYYGEQTIPFSCGTTVCGSTVDVATM